MRFDIAFILCCCRSFLSSNGRDEGESYYELLGVERKASAEELKRAYKRQSLQMHPDKLAQKGIVPTPADRDRFTKMRHAYEVLSDPRRRETYDAIGEQGMKWVEEPLSVDPQTLAHNFATSSIMDRSKIFGIFLAIYIAVFLLPVLVCLMIDGTLHGAKWVAVLTPLWVWDAFILFYHSRVIMMGPIKRPDHIPEEEWVDPLPMWKRIMSLVRFIFLVLFELLLALRLDGFIHPPWSIIFIPIYLWESIALRKKLILANIRIVTHDELELILGKKFVDCTIAERESIHRRFIVVPTKEGTVYEAAKRLKSDAKGDVIRILARVLFTILLVVNLDAHLDWSWWLVFLPIWGMSFCIVGTAFSSFSKMHREAVEKDPETFGGKEGDDGAAAAEGGYAAMGDKKTGKQSPLSEEEKDELKAKVMHLAYRAIGTCLSQCFLLFLMCLLVGKIEGAGYSSLLIIFPFLAFGGLILTCLACTIFCISEVDENAGMVDFDSAVAAAAAGAAGYGATENKPQYTPPTEAKNSSNIPMTNLEKDRKDSSSIGGGSESSSAPKSTWDPEKGQVWEEPKNNQDDKESSRGEAPTSRESPENVNSTQASATPVSASVEGGTMEESKTATAPIQINESYDLD